MKKTKKYKKRRNLKKKKKQPLNIIELGMMPSKKNIILKKLTNIIRKLLKPTQIMPTPTLEWPASKSHGKNMKTLWEIMINLLN